jgi:hypothetical protein
MTTRRPTLLELLERNPPPAPEPKPEPPKRRKGWRWRKDEEQPAKPDVLREAQAVADRAAAANIHPRDTARAFDTVADRVRQRAAMTMPLGSSIF